MRIAEFEDLLDRLGEDLSRWPSDQEQSAWALLAESAEAQELLREAKALRAALSGPRARAPRGLADRIVTQATQPTMTGESSEKGRVLERMPVPHASRPALRTAFLAFCFVVGIFSGVVHSVRLLDANEVDFHEFVAYITDMMSSTE